MYKDGISIKLVGLKRFLLGEACGIGLQGEGSQRYELTAPLCEAAQSVAKRGTREDAGGALAEPADR